MKATARIGSAIVGVLVAAFIGCSTGANSHPKAICTDTICPDDAGGAPSDTYPAPHPSLPESVNKGGPVMTAPKFVAITFDGDPMRADIESFVSNVGTTDYFVHNAAEYGVKPATSGPPIHRSDAPSSTVDDTAVQSWLTSMLDGTHPEFGTPDENTLYIVFYPAGTTVTLGQVASCRPFGFGGYHSSVTLPDKREVPYAVIPRCAVFANLTGFDMVTGTTSHELLEAVTDPFPFTRPAYAVTDDDHWAWSLSLGGGEIGDLCAQDETSFFKEPTHGFMVQRTWSNAAAKADKNPCVPAPANDVYFNSSVMLDEPVSFDLFGETIHTKGIHLGVGQSKTIGVDLFSDGPMPSAWAVQAYDLGGLQGTGSALDLKLSPAQGQNGQKLQLTITVLSADPSGVEPFLLASSYTGAPVRFWAGLVATP